jgi:hypothetical protein
VGKEKLRQISELEKNKPPEEDPEFKPNEIKPDYDSRRRGKPI